ncbi:RNA polymerase sigma factor [Breznakia pachnodae]|uniref:RNA polymerase sigma factor n=1 Tax=Breznakia pachnodae TaxID=265178 RepID=A0ABU0E1L3_9FIRM|nr:sigma-70 family RNA polymerase sigma factor [Breznakia pachnodae]MDQ0360782.1 RNA polymerase sigma factor (sigma-70 family) [Breznakia pachnodae]
MKNEIKKIDIECVKRYQKNPKDLDAFNEIYNFYKDYLYFFTYTYVKNSTDAEEIVQETFIKVIKKIHTLEKPEAFHAWLYRICYTNVMLHYRKRKKYFQLDEEKDFEEIEDEKINTEDVFTKNEIYTEVEQSIDQLGSKFKSIAQLYYFDELKLKEISEVLNVPVGTIKSRLNKIRSDIKGDLEAKGIHPNQFLSIGFTPFMYGFYEYLMSANPLTLEQSDKIYNALTATALTTSTALLSSGSTSSKIAAKLAASLGVATAGTFGLSLLLKEDQAIIQQVNYYNELTNKSVEVNALLREDIEANQIEVSSNNMKIEFDYENNILTFFVDENGAYEIKVENDTKEIEINNIDKEAPIINEVSYVDNGVHLSMEDQLSGVNFENSYAEYNGSKYTISENGIIEGMFEDVTIKVYLSDYSGNESVYDINTYWVK